MKLLIVLFMTLTIQTVFAYPIRYQTLRALIERSEYIVIASVDNPLLSEQSNPRGDGLADLYIRNILKGKHINSKHIQVAYNSGLICPAPPKYPDKEQVIAFLIKDKSDKKYYTVGLSYGSKIMKSEDEIISYSNKISEYLNILEIKKESKKKLATVEWLVKCIEDEFTRCEAAHDLSIQYDSLNNKNHSVNENLYALLTESQKYRIDNAFFSTAIIDYGKLCMISLITNNNLLRIKKHLIEGLLVSNRNFAIEIMEKIIELFPNEALYPLLYGMYNWNNDEKDIESKQKALIEKFIEIASQE